MLNNPKIKIIMGINGRKRFENKFTLKIFEKNLISILNNVINKSKI